MTSIADNFDVKNRTQNLLIEGNYSYLLFKFWHRNIYICMTFFDVSKNDCLIVSLLLLHCSFQCQNSRINQLIFSRKIFPIVYVSLKCITLRYFLLVNSQVQSFIYLNLKYIEMIINPIKLYHVRSYKGLV